jgi:hypothetical protein
MPVIHCTRKLAAKLPGVSAKVLEEAGGLGSWHAHLVRFGRVQCVLFCHDETRYCLFLPGMRAAQLAELGRWHREVFCASLATEGIADAAIAIVDATLGPAQYDAKTDRSVLASMNIALGDLVSRVEEVRHILELDALRASQALNRRPTRAHGEWLRPGRAMGERVAPLAAGL